MDLTNKLNSLNEVPEIVNFKEVLETALNFSELSKTLHLTYLLAKTPQKEEITSIVFSELKLSGNNLLYKGRNGFRIFESPFMALGDPTGWFSELIANVNLIENSIEEMNKIITKF